MVLCIDIYCCNFLNSRINEDRNRLPKYSKPRNSTKEYISELHPISKEEEVLLNSSRLNKICVALLYSDKTIQMRNVEMNGSQRTPLASLGSISVIIILDLREIMSENKTFPELFFHHGKISYEAWG